tara:strand:- start:1729 stop:2094 length:366 start_codon:yes stop_codon:yes gene_type:complete
MNKQFELTDDYIKKLKTLLRMKKITSYDVAHASFRKANQHCIISSTDKRKLTITFINGDVKKFPSIISLLNEIKIINKWYKSARRKYIKRYYKVIGKWNNRHKNKPPKQEQFNALIEKYNI